MSETSAILKGRISYPTLFEPKVPKGSKGDPRYGCQLMIEKDTKEGRQQWKTIEECVKAAIEIGVKTKKGWDGEIPKKLRHDDLEDMDIPIIKDGDDRDVHKKNPEYKGHWVISMGAPGDKPMPQVVDRNLKEIIKPEKIYAGCVVRVDVNFFPFDTLSNGISCGLNSVQFWEDGEPLTKRRSASEAFGDGEEEAERPKSKFKDLL